MASKMINTDIIQLKQNHHIQRKTLKERVEKMQKRQMNAEIQRKYLRERVNELTQSVR